MARKLIIIIAIIFLVITSGILLYFNTNIITGAVIKPNINIEYFRINNFGMKLNGGEEKLNDTQNNSRSG